MVHEDDITDLADLLEWMVDRANWAHQSNRDRALLIIQAARETTFAKSQAQVDLEAAAERARIALERRKEREDLLARLKVINAVDEQLAIGAPREEPVDGEIVP